MNVVTHIEAVRCPRCDAPPGVPCSAFPRGWCVVRWDRADAVNHDPGDEDRSVDMPLFIIDVAQIEPGIVRAVNYAPVRRERHGT